MAKSTADSSKLTKILQIVALDDTGDANHRLRWPAQQLASQEPSWSIVNLHCEAKERYTLALEADLLILYQCLDRSLIPIIEERQRSGLSTLVEYNDNFYAPPSWSPVAPSWASPLVWHTYEHFMQVADGLIVTGPGLQQLFSLRTKKPIFVIKNHLPEAPEGLPSLMTHKTTNPSLGWAGSLGHMADMLSAVPLLERLVTRIPTLTFHLMGNASFPSLLRLPQKRLRFREWGSMDDYFDFWTEVQVGLIPLLATEYNRCRSDIKPLEMIARGVLPLVPRALPYEEFIAETGMPSWSTYSDLEDLAHLLLSDSERRSELLESCYDYVKNKRVGGDRTERRDLFVSFLPKEVTTPESKEWPKGPGYHEMDGSRTSSTKSTRYLERVQATWNLGKKDEALRLLEEAPYAEDPEFALVRARCLAKLHRPAVFDFLRECEARFPKDLRFFLITCSLCASSADRLAAWRNLLELLCEESYPYRTFFEDEVIALFFTHQKQEQDLVRRIGRDLLEIYPINAQLLLLVGEDFQREGRDREALDCFEKIQRMSRELRRNRKFLSGTSQGYLDAWTDALKKRVEG